MGRLVCRLVFSLAAAGIAGPAMARDLPLAQPVDCILGQTCYIQNFVDRDPGQGFSDFACGNLGYDGHKGTDFALLNRAAIEAGVNVLAAAPGVVRAVRDGMPDILFDDPDAPDIEGRECGNGLVIDHGGGWETQYCHLRQGSLIVQQGQRVAKGAVLGQIGLSGRTEFPHLHLSVRKDGAVIDPFSPESLESCGGASNPLWTDPISYRPGGLLDLGFSSRVPEFDDIQSGGQAAETLPTDAPGLVLWGYFFGGQPGDRIRIHVTGPEGYESDQTVTMDRSRAIFFRAAGRKRPPGGWPEGLYQGKVTFEREGKLLGERSAEIRIGAP